MLICRITSFCSEGLLNSVGRNDERFKKTNWNGRTGQKKLGKDKNFDILFLKENGG